MSSKPPESDPGLEVDPLFLHSLREARFILGLWACCFVYTVVYCYAGGYLSHEPSSDAWPIAIGEVVGPLDSFQRDPDFLTYPLGLGIPDWVFYGVVVPWGVCIVLTFWYAFFLYAEDDLSSPEERLEDETGAPEA